MCANAHDMLTGYDVSHESIPDGINTPFQSTYPWVLMIILNFGKWNLISHSTGLSHLWYNDDEPVDDV